MKRPKLFALATLMLSAMMSGSLFVAGQTPTLPAPLLDRVGFPADYRSFAMVNGNTSRIGRTAPTRRRHRAVAAAPSVTLPAAV